MLSNTASRYECHVYDAMHYMFTGKERDAESGLDYFGARYYASNMGRWMSPDWADKPEAVPYSDLANPQSLNLYNYVNNNPLSHADADGHCPECVVQVLDEFAASPAGQQLSAGAAAGWAAAGAALGAAGGYMQSHWDSIKSAASSIDWSHYPTSTIDGIPMNQAVMNQDGAKSVPNPNGSKGAPDHQQTADEEAAKMGPNGQREVRVPTPGGEKGSRVIDAAKVENSKVTQATQVVRTNKNGTPVSREVRAARDIQNATGVQPKLVPVRPLKENQ